MDREIILDKIRNIIFEIADINKEDILEDSSMMDDLSLSSMEVFAVIAEVEEAFFFKVSEKDLRNIITVKDLVDCVGQ